MNIEWWQMLLICLYAFIQINEQITINVGLGYPLIAGMFTGLVMGDLTLGLQIGATLQLMVLGVGTFGGASMPDFVTGAIIGTVMGVISGKGMEFGLGIAVPAGLLLVQLDILARFSNTFFLHRVDKAIENNDTKGIAVNTMMGAIPWGLSRLLPVVLVLIFGESMVNGILAVTPEWLIGGLRTAGGLLPVVGIGILLRYLPLNRFFPYLIIGFVTAAYIKMPMMGVALLGIAFAVLQYKRTLEKPVVVSAGSMNEEIDDDEL